MKGFSRAKKVQKRRFFAAALPFLAKATLPLKQKLFLELKGKILKGKKEKKINIIKT